MGASLKDPKRGKSFRAAGGRIIRQESSTPHLVSRLLSSPAAAAPKVETDDEAWAVRLAGFARIGQYDAMTLVVEEPVQISRGYNLLNDPLSDPGIAALVADARQGAATARLGTAVGLVDGRAADAVMVAPLVMTETCRGALIAFRIGRSFAAADALTAYGFAELLALEIARALSAPRADADRRQALTLYELGRLALFGDDPGQTLRDAVAIVANTVDHDTAHLWILREDGALQLRAAHHQDGSPLAVVRPRDHGVLSEALVQRRAVRVGSALPSPWVPSGARSLIVAPLTDRGRALGVLVLGRVQRRYRAEDAEFAAVVGSFIGRLVSVAIGHAGEVAPLRRPAVASRTFAAWRERELVGELTAREN